MIPYKLDCRPSPYDQRDRIFRAPIPHAAVPDNIAIEMGTAYDQGPEGSCTGNAQAKGVWSIRRQRGLPEVEVSRAMIYWLSRFLEGTTSSDSGSTIADSMAALYKWGACPEREFAYVPGDFRRPPTAQQYIAAEPYRISQYETVPLTPDMIGQALYAGHAVSIGFSVYTSFEYTGPDGRVPDPAGSLLGGHNVLICGQRRSLGEYDFVNSWGRWGRNGYGTMKANYLFSRLVFEAKAIDAVVAPAPNPVDGPRSEADNRQHLIGMLQRGEYLVPDLGWRNGVGQHGSKITLSNGRDPNPPIVIAVT